MPPRKAHCPPYDTLSPAQNAAFKDVFYAMGDYLSHVPLDGSPLRPHHLKAIQSRLQRAKTTLHTTREAGGIIAAIDNALAALAQPQPTSPAFCRHLQNAMQAFKPLQTRTPAATR